MTRMETTLSKLRSNLKKYCDQAVAQRVPIRVRRRSGEDIVVVSADEYDRLAETAHLVASPKNAARLLAAWPAPARRKESPAPSRSYVNLAVFDPLFREDLAYWVEKERKVALRVLRLVEAVLREPFTGEGKPEPLKGLGPDVWSRRITQEHRLVYLVKKDRIHFLQARYHY